MIVDVNNKQVCWQVNGKVRAKANNGFKRITEHKKIIVPFISVSEKGAIFEFVM